MLKRLIVADKNNSAKEAGSILGLEFNLVLPRESAIIDLPCLVRDRMIQSGKVKFKAKSWCMFPVIQPGDTLKVDLIKPENLSRGDIVVYKYLGYAYAHRLLRTYYEEDRLYMVTSGEADYKNGRFVSDGILADNILGKVTEVKRGRLRFNPYKAEYNSLTLTRGRLKMSLWNLVNRMKRCLVKIFLILQGNNLYRYFLRRLIKDKISFFVGIPVIKDAKEINNFCFYQKFNDFFNKEDFKSLYGIYNISVRIINKPVGSISLFIEKTESRKVCSLSNFIVKVPFRGAGIGYQLLDKALYFCGMINADEINVVSPEKDKIAYRIFAKLGFNNVTPR